VKPELNINDFEEECKEEESTEEKEPKTMSFDEYYYN